MSLIHADSLAATVDAVNEAVFFNRVRCKAARRRAARWISERVGMRGGYAGMPALTDADRQSSYVMFTGEKVSTGAGRGHILGEEACRAMRMLSVNDDRIDDAKVVDAVERAEAEVLRRITHPGNPKGHVPGTYCCAKCSVALWRNIAAGGMDHHEARLQDGVAALRARRDGKGRWKQYPYWFTLSALIKMPGKIALPELRYAAPSCERMLRRKPSDDLHAVRRRTIAERVMQCVA